MYFRHCTNRITNSGNASWDQTCAVMFWVCNLGLLNENRVHTAPLLQLVEALCSKADSQHPTTATPSRENRGGKSG